MHSSRLCKTCFPFDLTVSFFSSLPKQAPTSPTENNEKNDRVRDEAQESDENVDLLVLVQQWFISPFLSPWCEPMTDRSSLRLSASKSGMGLEKHIIRHIPPFSGNTNMILSRCRLRKQNRM
jgi:hypothetical protein